MKKIVFILATALILGMGTMSAQNKFKQAQTKSGTTTKTEKVEKTEKAAPATTAADTKATQKAETKAENKVNAFNKSKASTATPTKAETKVEKKVEKKAEKKVEGTKTATKAAPKAAPKKVAVAKPVELGMFNGVWANSYSDGIGGMVTDYLNLTFDESSGRAFGEYKDENGDGRKVSGKLVGNALVMTYDADGDEFATIRILNENTLKLEGFTGTFKRVENMDAAPKVDIATPVTSAPVDPAYEEVKKYLEDN